MQPHRYFNELDHWRNISQRPHPSSPSLSPMVKPTTTNASMSKEETKSVTSDPFAVEKSRGWLEYGATVAEKTTSSASSSDHSNDSNNHQPMAGVTRTGIGVSSKKKGKDKATKSTINDSQQQQQQQKAKELLAVSNEDILNLTKMTAHLPDRTTNTSSSGGSNNSTHKHHPHHRRMKKDERTFSSTENLPTISTSTSNNNNSDNNYPSPTRPSVSTPSPSNRNNNNMGSNNENRRSWYKHLIKRDKGKNRMASMEYNEASLMIRDGSHNSSNNSSAMTTTTSSGGSNIIIDPTKHFMSAHHHPMSVVPASESGSDDGNQHYQKKFSNSLAMKHKGPVDQELPQHRRTSSEAAKMIAPSSSSPNNKRPSKSQFQRRHSLDSIRTPDDTHLFSSPEPFSGQNNNILASDVLHQLDDTESEDNVKKSEEIVSNRSSVVFGAITSEEEEDKAGASEEQKQEKRIMLDYDSLPPEVLGLLREYEKQGKIQIEERRVKTYKNEDDEEDDVEEDVVDVSDLVSSSVIPYDSTDDNDSIVTKKIATVRASRSDKAEFVKLVHLTDGNSMKNGYLLDLHVSILGDETEDEETNHPEEMQMLLGRVNRRIETLQKLTQDAKQFMNENKQAMDALTFHDDGHESFHSPWPSPANSSSRQTSSKSIHSIKEAAAAAAVEEEIKKKRSAFSLQTQSSSTTTATLSSTCSSSSPSQQRRLSSSIRHAPSSFLLEPHVSYDLPYNSVNPFDYRQEEVRLGVSALESEMADFKRELQMTEELIRDIQIDINDTRQRMSSYIKDIPETHYSALKKLEVDVESILANRAKNPWLDTGYAILSYLLTLFALLVWIIICGLKWGRTVVLFPRKLWRTYTEYLIERDRAVKKASLRSVSTGSLHIDPNAPSPSSSPPPLPTSSSSRHHYTRRPNSSAFMLSSSSSSIGASSTSSRRKSRIVHPSP